MNTTRVVHAEPVDARLAGWQAAADFAGVAAPVVCGCSGGADSLALLVLAAGAGLAPVAVYVDHGLRDTTSDIAAVERAADVLGVAHRVVEVVVGAGPNVEARARDARYEALDAARAAIGAAQILVGHTADDQAETVLLNLLRGSAASGLAGMPRRRGTLVRPMLGMRRADARAICAAFGLRAAHDPMNDDGELRRVAVRTRVLPVLEDVAARDLVPVLGRQADLLREESAYLDAAAAAAWPVAGGRPTARVLASVAPVLARRAIRQWLGSPPPSYAEVERVLQVARGQARGTQLAGGRTVRRRGGELVVDAE